MLGMTFGVVGQSKNHTKSDIDLGSLTSMPFALFSVDILKENIMRDIGTLGGGITLLKLDMAKMNMSRL